MMHNKNSYPKSQAGTEIHAKNKENEEQKLCGTMPRSNYNPLRAQLRSRIIPTKENRQKSKNTCSSGKSVGADQEEKI